MFVFVIFRASLRRRTDSTAGNSMAVLAVDVEARLLSSRMLSDAGVPWHQDLLLRLQSVHRHMPRCFASAALRSNVSVTRRYRQRCLATLHKSIHDAKVIGDSPDQTVTGTSRLGRPSAAPLPLSYCVPFIATDGRTAEGRADVVVCGPARPASERASAGPASAWSTCTADCRSSRLVQLV